MSDSNMLDQQLARLRVRFTERTLDQINEQLEQLSRWQPGMPRPSLLEALQQLQQLLHRLAGSSGTFGLSELGHQARAQEQTLLALMQTDMRDDEVLHQQLGAVTDGLIGLRGLLQTSRVPESPPVPAAATDSSHELLVLGRELTELADALQHYGFSVQLATGCETLDDSDWHRDMIILTGSERLQRVTDWNQRRAASTGIRPAPVLCAGTGSDFLTCYRLAERGVDGLFSLPADVPALVERIEQLRQERLQASQARVLLMDDDEELAERYRLVLSGAGMQVRVLTRPEAMMTTLAEFRPDILLMDIHMPPWSGTVLARMVRFDPQWLSLPIIYLSSEQDRDRQLHALAQGADEFITKPISDRQLVRVTGILCRRARQLSQLLSSDGLTGLLNHPHIKQALAHEHSRVQRLGHTTMVAMLDLDHFKLVNDHYGHATGDVVIRTLAHLLKRRLRHTDSLGRYGGEEFVVVLPDCHPATARALFEQLCRDFAALRFRGPQQEFSVTVSVGLARLNDFTSAEQGLNAADTALYERKRRGRNGVTDYAELHHQESSE